MEGEFKMTPGNTKWYGLFEKQNDKWVRLYPRIAYRKADAKQLFKGAIMNNPLNRAIKLIKENK